MESNPASEPQVGTHPCPLPHPRRKWRNTLYICDCGKGWRLLNDWNYAGDNWKWLPWPEEA